MRDVCYHEDCDRDAVPGAPFCRMHVATPRAETAKRPTTEDLAAEHDEVLAEVSEALRMWARHMDKVQMLRDGELSNREQGNKLVEQAKAYYDLEMEIVAQRRCRQTEAQQVLSDLSPEAREQLEARRVVVLDGTTYVVDASGDELQLLVSDPWVIS